MLEEIKEVVKALTLSNENIAKSLEIISANCASVDNKVDRNYETIVKIESKQAVSLARVGAQNVTHEDALQSNYK